MLNLKNRINKLQGKIMTTSNYESLLDRHSIETKRYPRGLDKMLLIDCVIALQVKDLRSHRLISKAKDFLAWASASEHNLIDRAYNLIEEQINAGYIKIRPEPLGLSRLNAGEEIPPYASLCTSEQLNKCLNKPFWVAA